MNLDEAKKLFSEKIHMYDKGSSSATASNTTQSQDETSSETADSETSGSKDSSQSGGVGGGSGGGDGSSSTNAVERIKKQIRDNTTPRHVPAKVVQVQDIPRTKSGKIVELAVRNVVQAQPVKNVEALANPEALEFFRGRRELAD